MDNDSKVDSKIKEIVLVNFLFSWTQNDYDLGLDPKDMENDSKVDSKIKEIVSVNPLFSWKRSFACTGRCKKFQIERTTGRC